MELPILSVPRVVPLLDSTCQRAGSSTGFASNFNHSVIQTVFLREANTCLKVSFKIKQMQTEAQEQTDVAALFLPSPACVRV